MSICLQAKGLTKKFGGVTAVDNVDLTVEENQVFSIIGPNGAGKTTFFNLVSGIEPPTSGDIFFQGEKITHQPVYKIARKGIGRTFQNIRLFKDLSVLDNILIGMHCQLHDNFGASVLSLPKHRKVELEGRKEAQRLLEFVGLDDVMNELSANLSYGAQRRVEIVRALASNPKLLMLDEPAAGMNGKEKQDLMEMIKRIREFCPTIVLIEHNMPLVMGISDRIMVLNFGERIAEGVPEEIQNNPAVIEAYLGQSE